eukprot:TRINITY_DN63473_c0_g1_i1.p1 TRINITY_DN63473_c0_g1~~TRINITY_DN63473_c0_g1_i1.p1  ORF type:complete len:131 (+),score=35.03 TRINITY_DN63473_c0_g1_i1:82-474(+)
MGNSTCCEGNKPDDAVRFSPRRGPGDDVVEEKAPMQPPNAVSAQAAKQGVPPEFQKLQGFWQTEGDRQFMGEIKGSNMLWDADFNHDMSEMKVCPDGSIEMDLMSEKYKGMYEEPGKLRWSDGEVWIRAP